MLKNQLPRIIILLVGLISILFVWKGESNFIYEITNEDGFVENLTAVFYLLGFIFCLIAIVKKKNKFLPILWAILCFVFLGEETSWFQRVFNYSVEAVEKVNQQGEFNLHNLKFFEGEALFVDGKLNGSGILNFLTSSQNIFRICFLGYFLIIPLLSGIGKIKTKLLKIGYIKPSLAFRTILVVVFALAFIFSIYSPSLRKAALAETREMLYAFYILFYVIFYIWYKKESNVLR